MFGVGKYEVNKHIILLGIDKAYRKSNFGLHCLETFENRFKEIQQIRVIKCKDRKTAFKDLESATHFLVFDVIDAGLAPGALAVFENDALNAYLQANPHLDWGLNKILNGESGSLKHAALIGIQVDHKTYWTPRFKVIDALYQTRLILSNWGVELQEACK